MLARLAERLYFTRLHYRVFSFQRGLRAAAVQLWVHSTARLAYFIAD